MEKTVFITGATRGIGLELTRLLLEKKFNVIASGRHPEDSKGLSTLKKDFNKTLTLVSLDVSDEKSIANLTKQLKDISQIDILINNAGVFEKGDDQILENIDAKKVVSTFMTNSLGPLRVTQILLPWLKKSKNPIVANITSQMGSIDDNKMGRYYGYRMSKAALNMFTKSFAVDYPNIIALTLHPGWVQTDMGGKQAPTPPSESAAGLIRVISNATKTNSGHFYNFKGDELPW